jgi:hypothetical protein
VVIDADTGLPVPGAQVVVVDGAGNETNIPLDAGDAFSLSNVPPGTYTLRVTAPCATETYEVTVQVPTQSYVVLPVNCRSTPPAQVPVQVPPIGLRESAVPM